MPLRRFALLLACALAPLAVPAAAAPVAQQQPICFPGVPNVANCIDPAFAAYWRGNGGLPVFGYPLGPLGPYTPAGADAPVSAQWTERNRLELHPENRAPYNVLIGRVGAERLEQLGRDHWADGGEPGPEPGCLWFPETRHNVCDQAPGLGFKRYWEGNGLRIAGLNRYEQSLALFGLPLTPANPEPGPNGELILTQWFERARFEWHPDNPDQFKVLLGLLGREVHEGSGSAPLGAPATPAPLLGVEINRGTVGATAGRLPELGSTMVRYNMVDWGVVEATRGTRNWAALAGLEAELAAISATGAAPLVIVSGAPAWAQRERGKACGPIRTDALDEFAAFVGEMVTRYSGPPYNVRHWEFGNEPDAPYQLLPGDSPFGCWGNERDADYGGGAYAEMLKAVYPAVKAANPAALVVTGGLLMDCDPAGPAPCASGRFFEGMLKQGAGAAFDILAFHSYPYWGPVQEDWDINHPKWKQRGGSLAGKLDVLRDAMAAYGVNKPILLNEGSLICYRSDPTCGPQGFYEDQANYAVRLVARSYAEGLYGMLWYTLNGPGWQESGLLDAGQNPRPTYTALRFIGQLLAGATYDGRSSDGPLESYRFRKGSTAYTIYWTNDGSARELSLPDGARALYTMLGEPRALTPTFVVGFEPLIVEVGAP
ncbi:MAG: hypothetical protein OHK0015_11870 [Chloroflexi bacterium OHK40]